MNRKGPAPGKRVKLALLKAKKGLENRTGKKREAANQSLAAGVLGGGESNFSDKALI